MTKNFTVEYCLLQADFKTQSPSDWQLSSGSWTLAIVSNNRNQFQLQRTGWNRQSTSGWVLKSFLTFFEYTFCKANVIVAVRAESKPSTSNDNSVSVATITPQMIGINDKYTWKINAKSKFKTNKLVPSIQKYLISDKTKQSGHKHRPSSIWGSVT